MSIGYRNRIVVLSSSALVLGLAACGSDSTGPKEPSPAALASHFDSIYSSYVNASETEKADLVGEFLELAPAYGGHQSTFTITTASGNQTWNGVTFGADDGETDTAFITAAYSDAALDNVLLIDQEVEGSSTFYDVALFQNAFTTEFEDSSGTAGHSVSSLSGSCSLQSGLVAEPFLTDIIDGGTCQNAKFSISANFTFASADSLGAFTTVSFSNAGFSGPYFADLNDESRRSASGPTRLHALTSKLRARFGAALHRAK